MEDSFYSLYTGRFTSYNITSRRKKFTTFDALCSRLTSNCACAIQLQCIIVIVSSSSALYRASTGRAVIFRTTLAILRKGPVIFRTGPYTTLLAYIPNIDKSKPISVSKIQYPHVKLRYGLTLPTLANQLAQSYVRGRVGGSGVSH